MARPDNQAEGDEERGFHERVFTRFAPVAMVKRRDSRQEQIENTLTVRSPALKSRPVRMAVRDILILPDKRLRLVSKPVAKIDAATRKLVEDMFETMYDAPGIGLAAIQIGEPKRVVTMDLAKKDEPKAAAGVHQPGADLARPSDKNIHEEGCLSIPEYYEEVERPAEVKVRYLDLDGKQHEIEADGLLATCIQHEIDHLNGVLFIDHISKLKRDRVIKKFTKAAKLGKPTRSKARRSKHRDMPLRLIFMGTPDFAVPTLLELAGQGHDIAAVYTRAAKPGGRRGLELVPSPVEREAQRLGLPCSRRRR